MYRLDDKVAAVTGGASGIGLAAAEAMLSAGARVVVIDRDTAGLGLLKEKYGDDLLELTIDLLDAEDCASMMPRIRITSYNVCYTKLLRTRRECFS